MVEFCAHGEWKVTCCKCMQDRALEDRDTLRAQLDAVTKERDKLQRAYDESAQKADSHRRLYEQACNDLGELRAVVKAVRVAYGNAPGRCGASDAPYRDLLYSINAALNSKVTP